MQQNKIKVEYFTDPLCAWSYATEDTIQRFIDEFKDRIDFKVETLPIMDRLASEADPEQKVFSPDYLKQEWLRISRLTDTRMDPGIWDETPPHSSWPGCRAVKAAEHQGHDQMLTFLHNFRIAIFQQKKNPSNMEVMKQIAQQSGLDVDRFYNDMTANAGDLEEMVNSDVQEAAAKCVESSPTLLFHSPNGDGVTISGPRDYNLFRQTMITLQSELKSEREREPATRM
jgi:predicted DsbA family dithiol-disulfide isomerase